MDTPMNRRVLDFRTIDEVVADVDQLVSTGYVKVGNWSLGQICRHLANFVKGSIDGFNGPRVSWLIRLFAPLAVRWMRKTRRMPAGVSVPAAYQPGADADDAAEVARLKEALRRFELHRGPLHSSPFGGGVERDECLDMHLIHCSHHLSFLQPAR